MQQHRYWRILCVTNDANYNSFQAAEIQFRAAAGGPALTGTVTGTTANDANSTVLKAIDGDPTTAYISSPGTQFPHFFAIDLGDGNASPVWEVAIMARRDQPRYAPNNFLVQWSDDGATWTTATTVNYVDPSQYVNNATTSIYTTFAVDSSDVAAGPTVGYPLALVNPSADLGNTTGWVAIGTGGNPGVLTNPGNGSNAPDAVPHSGIYAFVASANGSAPAWGQTVDIPSEAWADIDAGMYWANAMCWIKSWIGDDDYGRINVSCLDANGNKLSEGRGVYYSGMESVFWKKVGVNCVAPAGTRKLLVWTDSVRVNGTECSVYFDDFEVALVYPPDSSLTTPHRYWQMLIDENNGDNTYTTINQIEWLDPTGTPLTGAYVGVTGFLGGYPVIGLNSNDNLFCAMPRRGHWWVFHDFGGDRSVAVGALRVRHRSDGFGSQAAQNFRIQWSDDGINFFDSAKFERAQGWGNNESRTFYLSTDRYRVRYLREKLGAYFKGLELRGTVGGADLTFPVGPTTGYGGFAFGDSGNTSAAVLFDDLTNDNYVGNTTANRWAEWHFPATTTIAEIAVRARQNDGAQAPTEFYFERSTDQGFTYKSIGYAQTTFANNQLREFALAEYSQRINSSKLGEYVLEGPPANSIVVSKMAEYVVEGYAPNSIVVSKMAEYVVEGYAPNSIVVSKMAEYVVEGFGGIGITKTGLYVVEGPPAPGTIGPFVDAGGHRYWRIFIRRSNNNSQWPVGVTDMELRRSDGRNIVGFGGTPMASVNVTSQANWTPASAFDGNPSTMWQPDKNSQTVAAWGHGQWLGYDFGDGQTPRIDEIIITPNKDDVNRTPSFFEVQYSDDGNSWATDWIVGYRGSFALNTPLSFTRPVFDDPRKGRYWALHALNLQNNTTYQNLGGTEFQMMNEEDGTNLALGKTGFRSSASGNENVQNLFDGNVASNNYFSTTTPNIVGSDYVGCDFGPTLSIEVRQFIWRSRNDNSTLYQQSPVAGQMMRSNDGVNFVPMWQFSNLSYSGPGVSVTVNTPLPVASLVRGRRRNTNIVVF